MFKKILSSIVIICFLGTTLDPLPKAHADSVLNLPAPGTMVNLSPAYQPVIIRGLTVHKDNPFLFDFIVDVGQDKMSGEPLKKEGEKLIKYFLASLAIPDKDLWVNLSPYEKNRMIPEALGQTDMGRDLLEQDYILKQITASLIYPEKKLGQNFWNRVYAKAQEMYGTTQIPVNTFNKVWIMADKADIFEHNQTAFVVGCHLKVMLEEDYLALQKHNSPAQVVGVRGGGNNSYTIASQIVRSIILPELEKEINTGKNFANLRQIFNSVILSSWYKKNLKEALLNQVYADKSKVKGIDLKDPTVKEQIYDQYLKAYKKGVFNYIKEDVDASGATMPRKYFSGGTIAAVKTRNVDAAQAQIELANEPAQDNGAEIITTGVDLGFTDAAMLNKTANLAPQGQGGPVQNLPITEEMLAQTTLPYGIHAVALHDMTTMIVSAEQTILQKLVASPEFRSLPVREQNSIPADSLIVIQEDKISRISSGRLSGRFGEKAQFRVIVNDAAMITAAERVKLTGAVKRFLQGHPGKITDPAMMGDIKDILDGINVIPPEKLKELIQNFLTQNPALIPESKRVAFVATMLRIQEISPEGQQRILGQIERWGYRVEGLNEIVDQITAVHLTGDVNKRQYLRAAIKYFILAAIVINAYVPSQNPGIEATARFIVKGIGLYLFTVGISKSLDWGVQFWKILYIEDLQRMAVDFQNSRGEDFLVYGTSEKLARGDLIVKLLDWLDVKRGIRGGDLKITSERVLDYFKLIPDKEGSYKVRGPSTKMKRRAIMSLKQKFSIHAAFILLTIAVSYWVSSHVFFNGTQESPTQQPVPDRTRPAPPIPHFISHHNQVAMAEEHLGGIDLNTSNGMQWKVSKDGSGVEMNVDPAMIVRMKRKGVKWLLPVIFKMTSVKSIWPLVGLQAPAVVPR